MLQVAAYCRVSTDKEDQANSFEAQQRYFREYIQRQPDWELQGIYADEGFSGTSTNKRVEFNKMLHAAELGQIDLIVTKEVSRFTRNTVDALQITRELRRRGVGVLFLNDSLDTRTNDGELRLTIMSSFAQDESRRTSERSKWGQMRSMEKGVVFGGSLLGFDVIGGKMTVNPEGAEVVRLIFHKYLQERKGCSAIARELREAGILSSKGNCLWSSATVTKILKNEKYMGDALLQKTYTVDFLNKKRVKNEGIMPQYYVENDHPAIIPKSVFMQVQQIIKQRRNGITTKNGKHRRLNGKYCFSQKLFCGKCGDILQRNMWYRPEKVAVWRCASRIRRSKIGRRCMIRNVKEPLLKEATVEAFNQLIEGHELASKQIKANIMKVIKSSKGPTLDQLDKQLEEVQMKLIQAANQHQDCDALTQQIMDLRKQKEKVQSRETDQQAKLHNLDEINKLVELHKYGLVDFDEQLVRRLVEKITIFQRYMEFTFKDGEVIRVNM